LLVSGRAILQDLAKNVDSATQLNKPGSQGDLLHGFVNLVLESARPGAPRDLYDIRPLEAMIEAGYTLLTPNRRLAVHMLAAWEKWQREQGRTAWLAPRIVSLEAWLDERWQSFSREWPLAVANKQKLSKGQAHQLWCRCIRASDAGDGLLHVDGAAKDAASAYQHLLLWQVDLEDRNIRGQFHFGEDSAAFLQWRVSFEEFCTAQGVVTAEQRVELLATTEKNIGMERIIPLEFDEIAPLHQQLFERSDIEVHTHVVSPIVSRSQALACSTTEAEYYTAAHWARQRLAETGGENARIGILVPDLGVQRAQIQRIFSEVFEPAILAIASEQSDAPFNFSAGIPLSQSPPVAMAQKLLRLVARTVPLDTAIEILTTGYSCHNKDDFEQRVTLIATLFDRMQDPIETTSFRLLALAADSDSPGNGICFAANLETAWLDLRRKQRLSPGEWAQYFWDVLVQLGWPGRDIPAEQEQGPIYKFIQTLEDGARWGLNGDKLDLESALTLLQYQLEETLYQDRSGEAQVQILGRLEGAGLRFTHLWLCGMGMEQWPGSATPNPFIPYSLQSQFNLPHSTPAREFEFCKRLTRRYQESAESVVFSYASSADGVQQQLSSLALAVEAVDATKLLGMTEPELYHRYWGEMRSEVSCIECEEVEAPLAPVPERLRGGAGLLEDQSNCGFRAFARHRLHARALNQVSPGLNALERGNLIHQALFHLWGQINGSVELGEKSTLELLELRSEAASSALDQLPSWRRRQLGAVTLDIENNRLGILLERWLEFERSRTAFTVHAREHPQSLLLNGISFEFRIDRIDSLESGQQIILDYKTGACSLKDWQGERPTKPQMPLYALANQDSAIAIAYARVQIDRSSLLGVGEIDDALVVPGIEGVQVEDGANEAGASLWSTQLDAWQEKLSSLLSSYLAGKALIDPVAGAITCQYCDLATLCRKHERDESE
jgi:ATP-dependent helicase/nuclease subunit B